MTDTDPKPYLDTDTLKRICKPLLDQSPKKKPKQPPPPGYITRPTTREGWLQLALANQLIQPDEAAAKRTRPDVVAKRQAGKKSHEFCRQVTLGALLKALPGATPARIETLQRLIDEAVERISRIMVQRSLLVAAYLTDKLDQAEPALVDQPPGDKLSEDPDVEEDEPESDSDCSEDPENEEADLEQGQAEDLPDLFGKQSNFLRRCFTVGVTGCTSSHAGLEAKLAEWADAFPELKCPRHVQNAVSHAAKLYRTNLSNHISLYTVTRDRLRRYVSSLLYGPALTPTAEELEQHAPDAEAGAAPQGTASTEQRKRMWATVDTAVKMVLDGYKESDAQKVGPTATARVQELRAALGLQADTGKLSQKRLKDNCWRVLALFKAMDAHYRAERLEMAALREADPKARFRPWAGVGLQLVPLHHQRRAMCVKIDLSDWARLLAKADLLGVEGKVDEGLHMNLAQSQLKEAVAKVLRKHDAGHLTGTIDTDGVTACIHLRAPLTQQELYARDAAKARKFRTRAQIAADAKAEAERRANREPRPLPRVAIMVDKGRVRLLHCMVFVDGKPFIRRAASRPGRRPRPVQFALSAGAYYTGSGVRRRMKVLRDSRRRAGLEAADRELAANGGRRRSTELEDILARARALARDQERAWAFAMRRKVRSWRFHNKVGKARVVHAFFSSIKRALKLEHGLSDKDLSEAVMVFGDAKFSASGRGNAPVPVNSVEHMAKRHFRVERCSEYGTSSACPVCAGARPKAPSKLGAVRVRANAAGHLVSVEHSHWFPMRSVRHGLYRGSQTRRLIRRMRGMAKGLPAHLRSKQGQATNPLACEWLFSLRRRRTTKYVYEWSYDGHSLQSEADKERAKKARRDEGCMARYVRGLRHCQVCDGVMDRDQCGAHGIFHHYLSELDPKRALPLAYTQTYRLKKAPAGDDAH